MDRNAFWGGVGAILVIALVLGSIVLTVAVREQTKQKKIEACATIESSASRVACIQGVRN